MKRWFVLVLRMHLHPLAEVFLTSALMRWERGGWLLVARAGV